MNTYIRPDNGANAGTNEDRNYFKNKYLDILNPEYRWVRNKEGRYFVNQYGDVFSCLRKKIKKLALHPNRNNKGYPRVCLDGHQITVHKLMLEAWKGLAPSPKYESCHYDDVAENNSISNLHWGRKGSRSDLAVLRNDPAHVDDYCEKSAKLYLNPSNLLEASFNRAMQSQWEIIQSHAPDCPCRLCSIGLDAVPINIRKRVLTGSDPVEP